jgi:hypothetical protein
MATALILAVYVVIAWVKDLHLNFLWATIFTIQLFEFNSLAQTPLSASCLRSINYFTPALLNHYNDLFNDYTEADEPLELNFGFSEVNRQSFAVNFWFYVLIFVFMLLVMFVIKAI